MTPKIPPKTPSPNWKLVSRQVEALAEGERHWLPTLANASALLWDALDDVNWVGFYLRAPRGPGNGAEDGGDELVLGPFQGKVACTHIALGSGVCGTAAARDATQLVPDVHAFAGHIACDGASRSEVVVPLHDRSGRVSAVLDVDSPTLARFSAEDAHGLELVAAALERVVRFGDIAM